MVTNALVTILHRLQLGDLLTPIANALLSMIDRGSDYAAAQVSARHFRVELRDCLSHTQMRT